MINLTRHNKEKFFDQWAPHYDSLFTTVFYQAIHKRLLEYVVLPKAANILDVGCGTGRLLNRLVAQFSTLQGTGLDLSSQMLQQAQQRQRYGNHLVYQQGNAESLPFAQGQFDAVFNTLSFLHYPNPQQVFLEVRRVLRPGGHFYLVDFTLPKGTKANNFPFSPGGVHFYSQEQREQLGIATNLECLGHHYLLGPVVLSLFTPL